MVHELHEFARMGLGDGCNDARGGMVRSARYSSSLPIALSILFSQFLFNPNSRDSRAFFQCVSRLMM